MNSKFKVNDIIQAFHHGGEVIIFKVDEVHQEDDHLASRYYLQLLDFEGVYLNHDYDRTYVAYVAYIDNNNYHLLEAADTKIEVKTCICPIFDLCNFGCKCGGK